MLLIAHVSDLHLDGSERNAERASRVMRYLNDLPQPLDALLVTGDIADHGLAEEYDEARKILASPHRVLTCPGNHDSRGPYRETLLGQPAEDTPINELHGVGGALIALCDSSIPGRADGWLADETLDWLDRVLAKSGPDVPAFVGFHHPPVLLHSAFIDEIRQHGADRLAAIIQRHPAVVAVLCGHAHTAAASTFAGRPVIVAPGVVSTLTLPWETRPVLDYSQPPAVAFHVLDDDWRLTTHYRVIAAAAEAQ